MIKIILLCFFSIKKIFAECFYDCCDYCCICCDCCDPDKITDEDGAMTENILKHLKLDNGKLNDIAVEINNIQNNEEKIKKIIEYTKDIDWKNECCPNTLIKWEKNECAYIAYFDLMLNNPYFLKFFLICAQTMRREETYVLNAICNLVEYCVEHPRFEGEYRGSVDKIMRAFFMEEWDEYYYLKKGNIEHLRLFYYEKNNKGEIVHYYGSFLPENVYSYINQCLYIDLNLSESHYLTNKVNQIIYFSIDFHFNSLSKCVWNEKAVEESIANAITGKMNLAGKKQEIIKFEKTTGAKVKKVLGIWFHQYDYHYFAFTKKNDIWYNKNTLRFDSGEKKTEEEVLKFCESIPNFPKISKDKDWEKEVYKKIYREYCYIVLLREMF